MWCGWCVMLRRVGRCQRIGGVACSTTRLIACSRAASTWTPPTIASTDASRMAVRCGSNPPPPTTPRPTSSPRKSTCWRGRWTAKQTTPPLRRPWMWPGWMSSRPPPPKPSPAPTDSSWWKDRPGRARPHCCNAPSATCGHLVARCSGLRRPRKRPGSSSRRPRCRATRSRSCYTNMPAATGPRWTGIACRRGRR